MTQYRTYRLGIARGSLTFHRCTLSFVTHKEIKFHTTVFMKIIQLASHLTENICHKVLFDGTMITKQIALQYTRLSAIFKH